MLSCMSTIYSIPSLMLTDFCSSALPNDRLGDQTKLVDALAGANNLSLFIPSDYGTYWTEEDLKIANLPWLNVKEDVVAHAKEKRVPTAVVKGGLFPAAFTFPGE